MTEAELLRQTFEIEGGDFRRAGQVSGEIKKVIRQLGIPADLVRRISIASFEAEMNVVVYARRGRVSLIVLPGAIRLEFSDEGPGIEDLELAMREGYSTAPDSIRELGFGAGMGLPNIRKNADEFEISSEVGSGTELVVVVHTRAGQRQAA